MVGRKTNHDEDSEWLKSFDATQDAINNIQSYFEDAFNNLVNNMGANETVKGNGASKEKGNLFWWEAYLDTDLLTELFFAAGIVH